MIVPIYITVYGQCNLVYNLAKIDLAFLVPLRLRESDLGMMVPFFVYCNSWNDAEHSAMYMQS